MTILSTGKPSFHSKNDGFLLVTYIQKIVYICVMKWIGLLVISLLINFVAINVSNTYSSGVVATGLTALIYLLLDNIKIKIK